MSEPHARFQAWLLAGAEGNPPRDLAVHASVCSACRASIAAFDRLAFVDPGAATIPAPTRPVTRGALVRAGRALGATFGVLIAATVLGVGGWQLIEAARGGPDGIARASGTPNQAVLAGSGTPGASVPAPSSTPASTPPTSTPTPTPAPTPVPSPPGAPLNLVASAGAEGGVQLSWDAAPDGGSPVTSYQVYRGTASGSELFLTSIGPELSYLDDSAVAGTEYFYVITAANAGGKGPASDEVFFTP